MKKLIIVALVVMLLPAAANAYDLKDGTPSFIFNFPGGTISVVRGETWCEAMYAANFGYKSYAVCTALMDTFAVVTSDLEGWAITNTFLAYEPMGVEGEDAEGMCYIVDDNGVDPWYFVVDLCISVPCTAMVGDLNTFYAQMAYCDVTMTAQPDSGDCGDADYSGEPNSPYQAQDFEIVESPPALYILQDTLYFVEQGQTAAYIPFSVCNGDACAPATLYDYAITSQGTVGGAINITGTTVAILGGACGDVYGVVDAGTALVCTYDTLTIIAWDQAGIVYDTCVQAIHVVEPVPVPLFTAPVVTILVLAMILAAAVIMKRHAVSKA